MADYFNEGMSKDNYIAALEAKLAEAQKVLAGCEAAAQRIVSQGDCVVSGIDFAALLKTIQGAKP